MKKLYLRLVVLLYVFILVTFSFHSTTRIGELHFCMYSVFAIMTIIVITIVNTCGKITTYVPGLWFIIVKLSFLDICKITIVPRCRR